MRIALKFKKGTGFSTASRARRLPAKDGEDGRFARHGPIEMSVFAWVAILDSDGHRIDPRRDLGEIEAKTCDDASRAGDGPAIHSRLLEKAGIYFVDTCDRLHSTRLAFAGRIRRACGAI